MPAHSSPTTDSIDRVYLDYNATTRPFAEVVDCVAGHFANSYANPGSRHYEGRKARQVLENARDTVAHYLDADPKEVVFTSGGTEATNIALLGATRSMTPGVIALTAGEHPATIETCLHLEKLGWRLHYLAVDRTGRFRPEQYDQLPWDELRLMTVILAHNETGVLQDLDSLASRCQDRGVFFHADAVQAVGKIPVSFRRLGVSTLALGAHKFHGPRGIGALLVRDGIHLEPILFGGHQESELRPGTELVALAAGMAIALEICHRDLADSLIQIAQLRDRLQLGLQESCAPVVINGSLEHRLPNTLNISFPGVDGDALLIALDLDGVACSLGSTCASGSAEPAPVLVAMGCPADVYSSAVRFSTGRDTTGEHIDAAVLRISNLVNRLRASSD